ncbi:MAG: GNAT family N-acetyltransferase [Clostridia bacterium]|nr:GNAT family N-acetyltransferase [Clostridia bacterium]
MVLEGKRVTLKSISYEDTDDIVRWRNRDAVRSNFIYREEFTKEVHEKWIKEKVEPKRVFQFIIIVNEENRKIGSIYLRDIDTMNQKCEFGIFIGEEEFLGRGLGTEAAKLILHFAFEELKMNKVFLRLLAENRRAFRSYLKVGFKEEGLSRQDVLIDGLFHDVIFMSILRGEL